MTVQPDLPDECWPVDTSRCEAWETFKDEDQAYATALAQVTMRQLVGYRLGGCPITVRPCSRSCAFGSPDWYWGGSTFYPYVTASGEWVNACCWSDSCDHLGAARIFLPGPVGMVVEVRIDGEVVSPTLYRIDNGNELVRLDGDPWPTRQDMSVAPNEVGAFAVTYLRGIAVDGLGSYAAGALACEFAASLAGRECRLPDNVTSITRQGVNMDLVPGFFPNGVTGIREVDAYVQRWNPKRLTAPMRTYSPDLMPTRRTTWPTP